MEKVGLGLPNWKIGFPGPREKVAFSSRSGPVVTFQARDIARELPRSLFCIHVTV